MKKFGYIAALLAAFGAWPNLHRGNSRFISPFDPKDIIPGDVSDRMYSPYGRKQRQRKIQRKRYSKVVASYAHPNPTEWLVNHA